MTLVLFVAAMGCTNASVKTDFDPSRDFTTFQTYSWMELPLGTTYDATGKLHDHIQKTIDDELKANGLSLVADSPDLVVMYYGNKSSKVALSQSQYQNKSPMSGTMPYDEGTLVVDLIDPASDKIVWRGTAEGIMPEASNLDDKFKFIDKGVADMFKKYPPK